MNPRYTFLLIALFSSASLFAQSTLTRVYEIFEAKCTGCHGHVDPEAGLDLEGVGATANERALDVYGHLFGVIPANADAAAKGFQYIYPGRPDRSFLFRKVNHGLEPLIELGAAEGDPMPKDEPPLSEVERELIRQWVLFGAKPVQTVIDEQLLVDYYGGQGLASFDTPPPPPDPSEGFQIKMGPFFLAPAGEPLDEREFFQKYELDLPEALEVYRMELLFSSYSHHFILFDYDSPSVAQNVAPGFRPEPYHQGISYTAAVQEPTDLLLPQGTAFLWGENMVLDLNSHYINYSANQVYQAEVYVNVYTQPSGTAAQEMQTTLFANFDIYIPNDGDLHTFSKTVNSNSGEVFLWGLMGHTHKYGKGYKVYRRTGGQQGELLYDASCPQGIPGCVSPYFDYQHIPMRLFAPLQPLTINPANGFIHEASWLNYGPEDVWYGPTSDDEMMLLVAMFTFDDEGVVIADAKETAHSLPGVRVSPNPADDRLVVSLPENTGPVELQLFDALGRQVLKQEGAGTMEVSRNNLPAGWYLYRVRDEDGRLAVGKIVFE